MLGVFAGLALLLAGVGLYAVMARTVVQRTHELGVRLALGAQSRAIVVLVVRQGMSLVAIGIALGLPGAYVLTRVPAPSISGATLARVRSVRRGRTVRAGRRVRGP